MVTYKATIDTHCLIHLLQLDLMPADLFQVADAGDGGGDAVMQEDLNSVFTSETNTTSICSISPQI
jgi:hypothetical protein